MAKDMNCFNGIGYIASDVTMSYLKKGTGYCDFVIAINDDFKRGNEVIKEVSFLNCRAWTGLAESIVKYCGKGSRLAITAKVTQERWEDAAKIKQSRIKFILSEAHFISNPNEEQKTKHGKRN